jgi:hypothetical protein
LLVAWQELALTNPPTAEQMGVMPVASLFNFSRLSRVSTLCFAAVALAGETRGAEQPDLQISQLKNVRMGFFSSIASERLAHLQFAEAAGAQRKLGPFQIATPGVALKDARLEINATPCTAADWTAFTGSLAKYRAAQLPQSLGVRLPDGRECITPRFPAVKGSLLVFAPAQLRTPGGDLGPPQTVVVGWQGNAPRVLQPLAGPSPESATPASVRLGAPAPIPAPDPASPL